MIRDIRKQYEFSALTEDKINRDPFRQFEIWLHEAIESSELEPTAMTVSTIDKDMQPQSRVVLLKEIDKEGFVFFTNYDGNKGQQIEIHPKVSLLFFWPSLERQVRITGEALKISEAASDDYFFSRPLESRIGAWTSPQSQVIANHEVLYKRFETFREKFQNEVPRPPHWGGFVVRPATFEFWQGRPNRLHDRLFFEKAQDSWSIKRLAP